MLRTEDRTVCNEFVTFCYIVRILQRSDKDKVQTHTRLK